MTRQTDTARLLYRIHAHAINMTMRHTFLILVACAALAAAQIPNTPPVITCPVPQTASVGVPFTYTPSATDADGDTLAWSAAGLPIWAALNLGTGQISGTPQAADAGSSTVTITVSDGMDTDSCTITITVPGGGVEICNGLDDDGDGRVDNGAVAPNDLRPFAVDSLCNYAGACRDGACECVRGWTGARCNECSVPQEDATKPMAGVSPGDTQYVCHGATRTIDYTLLPLNDEQTAQHLAGTGPQHTQDSAPQPPDFIPEPSFGPHMGAHYDCACVELPASGDRSVFAARYPPQPATAPVDMSEVIAWIVAGVAVIVAIVAFATGPSRRRAYRRARRV